MSDQSQTAADQSAISNDVNSASYTNSNAIPGLSGLLSGLSGLQNSSVYVADPSTLNQPLTTLSGIQQQYLNDFGTGGAVTAANNAALAAQQGDAASQNGMNVRATQDAMSQAIGAAGNVANQQASNAIGQAGNIAEGSFTARLQDQMQRMEAAHQQFMIQNGATQSTNALNQSAAAGAETLKQAAAQAQSGAANATIQNQMQNQTNTFQAIQAGEGGLSQGLGAAGKAFGSPAPQTGSGVGNTPAGLSVAQPPISGPSNSVPIYDTASNGNGSYDYSGTLGDFSPDTTMLDSMG